MFAGYYRASEGLKRFHPLHSGHVLAWLFSLSLTVSWEASLACRMHSDPSAQASAQGIFLWLNPAAASLVHLSIFWDPTGFLIPDLVEKVRVSMGFILFLVVISYLVQLNCQERLQGNQKAMP